MRYNKKRNTAFLYEALVLEMTKAIINNDEERKDIALDILKENFSSNSILHEELDAYRAVLETKNVDKDWAEMTLREAQRTYLSLHPDNVFNQQTHVINRVNKELGKDTFQSIEEVKKYMIGKATKAITEMCHNAVTLQENVFPKQSWRGVIA